MFDKPPDSESWAAVMMMCDHIRHRSNEMLIQIVKTAPQVPSRRALAGIALVSVLSAVEKQRKKKRDSANGNEFTTAEDMSGELQTIPARHGAATFVPRGRTIKVINTYGKQVVSMWAFTLGPPPEEGEGEELNEEEVKKEAEEIKRVVEEGEKQEVETAKEDKEVKNESEEGKGEEKKESGEGESEEKKEEKKDGGKETQSSEDSTSGSQDTQTPSEKASDTPENEKTTESTDSPSKQPAKRTWASYLPSIPYRNKGAANKQEAEQKPSAEQVKKQNEENTKKWSSYLPTGKSFSSYVPNVEVPDSKSVISAFKSSHYRDPNKSYAEQLYDFSKTPVGAGTMAAATGSGYASSVYAAYSAYTSMHPSNSSQPPMEYLSLPHTRTASHKLVPEVNDELLTNLRNPILTLIEDTSPGAHDTLTAACDANQYAALGIDKPAEHGSCAENLVLALKEINETSGLKGAKAVGADITVNIAPTPLHLFMNAPLHAEGDIHDDGAGAKGVTLSVEEPQGKKRCYVRFRAERDVVVVFSACPMDVGKQNGGRCMASNFMVEEVKEGEDKAGTGVQDKKEEGKGDVGKGGEREKASEEPKPKKKPKKLEVRSQSTAPASS
ncbi:hypothetical protein COCHEDRAFT_1204633 [Bipolaris maydis C5]|uniref:DUF1989 domain-containing protein n=1 Tax=Cochliobolus heterostrophus (strain C5 / ATCC 48332 / race O) TaxID=701091 RepID=M2U8B5_COCH5|nr:hypothetical protein COCHEDRAFT_1204633 [Bipolaris maydis C5]KAJ6207830.1 hypothetical protein PSV09DRAFT_1204633 [Bipolaris maydis]